MTLPSQLCLDSMHGSWTLMPLFSTSPHIPPWSSLGPRPGYQRNEEEKTKLTGLHDGVALGERESPGEVSSRCWHLLSTYYVPGARLWLLADFTEEENRAGEARNLDCGHRTSEERARVKPRLLGLQAHPGQNQHGAVGPRHHPQPAQPAAHPDLLCPGPCPRVTAANRAGRPAPAEALAANFTQEPHP